MFRTAVKGLIYLIKFVHHIFVWNAKKKKKVA